MAEPVARNAKGSDARGNAGPVTVVFLSGMMADARLWARVISCLRDGDTNSSTGIETGTEVGIKTGIGAGIGGGVWSDAGAGIGAVAAKVAAAGAEFGATGGAVAIRPVIAAPGHYRDIGAMAGAVLAENPGRFAVVGMSMGGYVAFELLRRAPERISHLALINTRATADSTQERRRRILLARLAGRSGPFRGISDAQLDDMLHPDHRHDSTIVRLIGDMADDLGPEIFRCQSIAVAERPDSWNILEQIACPCVVMTGARDGVISARSHHEMAAAIPGAHCIEIAHAAHYLPLEAPQEVASALRQLLAGGR